MLFNTRVAIYVVIEAGVCVLIFIQLFAATAQTSMATLFAFHLVSNREAQEMLSVIPEDQSNDA